MVAVPVPDVYVDRVVREGFLLVEVQGVHAQGEVGVLLADLLQARFGYREPGLQVTADDGRRVRSAPCVNFFLTPDERQLSLDA